MCDASRPPCKWVVFITTSTSSPEGTAVEWPVHRLAILCVLSQIISSKLGAGAAYETSAAAFWLRVVLPAKNREQQLGDLLEEAKDVERAHGPRAARAWLWLQLLREARVSFWLRLYGFLTAAWAVVWKFLS